MGDLPPWFDPSTYVRQRQNRASAAQEARRAAEIGGRVQPGSGSSWRAPEDVQSNGRLEQTKYTDARRFALDAAELVRTLENAERSGKDAGWVIDFRTFGIRCVIEIERVTP